MKTSDYLELLEELDDNDQVTQHLLGGKVITQRSRLAPKRSARDEKFVLTQDDSRGTFGFTYKAARYEAGWLLDSLGYFYEQHWISDVLRLIRSGKEASVYLCRAGEQVGEKLVAAKVYRPRMLRNLRDDHLYREGRVELDADGHVLNDERAFKAILHRTAFGEEIRHQSWIAYEFTALQSLHEAGVDVPMPYEMAHNAILMDYFGDVSLPAPALSEVSLDPEEARDLFERLWCNVDLMLGEKRIHGDLSAYNVLYWQGDIAIIDFPQVVSPEENRSAFAIFTRDVCRLCEYFIDQGLDLHPGRLALDMWRSHGYRPDPRVPLDLLDADDPRDRRAWTQAI